MSTRKKITLKSKLVDLRPDQAKEEGLNHQIISLLKKLVKQISDENKSISDKDLKKRNNFRIKSLYRAISSLEDHDTEITSGKEATKIKGIGKGTADRIDEILETGTLSELADIINPETRAVDDLITVNGIGEKTALRFYRDYQIKSVADLISKWKAGEFVREKHKLTHHIELGLKYYDAFRVRIPRDEIKKFIPDIKKYLKKIDTNLIFEVAGSYRREKADSGDIDILLSHPDFKTKQELGKSTHLRQFVDRLMDQDLLIDHLDHDFTTYYKGVIVMDKIPRRIDIMIIPNNTWAAALMHNTGSGPFNQKIRAHAMMSGFHLSQHGLYQVIDGQKQDNPIPTTNEKEIFDLLGVKYLKPSERE